MRLSEEQYRTQLDYYLRAGNLISFERLLSRLKDDGINVDLTQLSDVEHKISSLFIRHLQTGMNIDEIFRLLKFANDFQLFIKTSKKLPFPISNSIQELIITNLENLFGNLSEGFFYYIVRVLPDHLSALLINPSAFIMLNYNVSLPDRIEYIYSIINLYTNYGLRTRKIGTFEEYLKIYEEKKERFDEDYYAFKINKSDISRERPPIEFVYLFAEAMSPYEQHLVYAPLLEKTKQKYRRGEYNFEYPIVSMVITGGIGPEGKGFVYLTPTGEVIEVCSDAKQSKAYIIEYKKYLKSIFLEKLGIRMQSWNISNKLKNETLLFFDKNIHTKMVGFNEIETLLEREILTYLRAKIKSFITSDFLAFLRKSLQEILIPVQMEDQFKVRMDLIKNNKLTETEVAKLVSLGDVSHFDVLNQRLFFLLLVDNIVRLLKAQNKL